MAYNTTVSILLGTGSTPQLSIAKTHSGNFTQGQNGANYSVTVSNAAAAGPTSGLVTVTETVPAGLTLVSMAGTGWTCLSGGTTRTRSDVLAAGASYPPIIVTVNVGASAASPQVNSVSVSGGGSTGATVGDSTTIIPAACSYSLSLTSASVAFKQRDRHALRDRRRGLFLDCRQQRHMDYRDFGSSGQRKRHRWLLVRCQSERHCTLRHAHHRGPDFHRHTGGGGRRMFL